MKKKWQNTIIHSFEQKLLWLLVFNCFSHAQKLKIFIFNTKFKYKNLFLNNSHGLKIEVINPHLSLVSEIMIHDARKKFGQDGRPNFFPLLWLDDLTVGVRPEVDRHFDAFGNLKLWENGENYRSILFFRKWVKWYVFQVSLNHEIDLDILQKPWCRTILDFQYFFP